VAPCIWHWPPGNFSFLHTLAQFSLLKHMPLNVWLCDRQCLSSETTLAVTTSAAQMQTCHGEHHIIHLILQITFSFKL
jgi:hypothetical protein